MASESANAGFGNGPQGQAVGAGMFLIGRRLYAAALPYSIARGILSGILQIPDGTGML